MPTKNNWLTSNLSERRINPTIDFKALFNPHPFRKCSLDDAVSQAVCDIASKHDKIYVALSGGLDSEYILLSFYNNNVPVIPIIVRTDHNKTEIEFAFHMCRKLAIKPVVLECSDELYVALYNREVVNCYNGRGYAATAVFVAFEYAKRNGGAIVTGEHVIDDEPFIHKASLCEWDFYLQEKDWPCYGLLTHIPEISWAIVSAYDGSPVQDFKSKLFGLSFRPKLNYDFNKKIIDQFHALRHDVAGPVHGTCLHLLGKKQEFLAYMNSWNADAI